MPRPSRLPGKTGCLSSCSRSGPRVRSRPCCGPRGASPSSAPDLGPVSIDPPPDQAECARRRVIRPNGEVAMSDPTYDINELKRRMHGAIDVLKHEFSGLRTGRASPSLLEPVQVEAYGSHMPLNQLATVSVPEPRLLSVQVWDKSMVHAVERAIQAANLGLNPATE